MKKMSVTSFNYLHYSSSIRRINSRYKLNEPKQIMVLEAVLSAYKEEKTLSISDLLLLKEVASQATLHAVTKVLIDLKLIKATVSQSDGRRKYVTPTKLAISWMSDCSTALSITARH